MGAKTAIAINLGQLRDLMREFVNECAPNSFEYEWRFSTFLAWLQKRQESSDSNVLTFRIEKGAGNGTK